MKLAILNITAGGLSGGYRKYLLNLLPRLSPRPEIDEILCALPRFINLNNIPAKSNIIYKHLNQYSSINNKLQKELNRILNEFVPDVIFVPAERFFHYKQAPVVTMVRNMEPFVYPFFNNPPIEKVKNLFRLNNAREAIKKADRIIAVSQFVKDMLVNRLRVERQKIGLVYHGVDNATHNTKRPFSIPIEFESFLFTAGSIRPARGLDDILMALKYLSGQGIRIPLVIAGETEPRMISYQRKLKDWVERNKLSSYVFWTGNLSYEEMNWCYRNCIAFVITSRAEACPNIVLEAMANQCVNISTEIQPMPEFFRDAAVYYPKKDGKALANLIKTVLAWNDIQRKAMSEESKKRAADFSWDVCADKTIEELSKAIRNFKKTKQT